MTFDVRRGEPVGGGRIGIAANGVGDMVMYCWLVHSLRAAEMPFLLSDEKGTEVQDMLGVPAEWRYSPGKPTAGGSGPSKGDGELEGGWLERWIEAYAGRKGVAPVCPPYVEREEDGVWAERFWEGRERERGAKGKRVLVMPMAAWASRCWTEEHWVATCNALWGAGANPVVVQEKYDRDHRYPFMVGGLSLRNVWAMTKRADVLVGVNSGPSLWAPTMGVKTVVVHGPTHPRWVHAHFEGTGLVRHVHVDRRVMPCAGCDWKPERGWRGTCRTCLAIMLVTPWEVAEAVMEMGGWEGRIRRDVVVRVTRGMKEIVPCPKR